MPEEPKLPWPGYRLRDGWRMLAVGEVIVDSDILSFCRPPEFDWRQTCSGGCIHNNSYPHFHRTDPNATLPPVEPIPVEPVQAEPGVDVRRALEIVGDTITELRRERDDLRKQVETLEAKVPELREIAVEAITAKPSQTMQPKRLEWRYANDYWSTSYYRVYVNEDGLFSPYRLDALIEDRPVSTLAEAQDICQDHADEQQRPKVEQPKAEAPAVAIEWPEGAIALTRDANGKVFFTLPDEEGYVWNAAARYTGPDPFPPDMPWQKCYLINPARMPGKPQD